MTIVIKEEASWSYVYSSPLFARECYAKY